MKQTDGVSERHAWLRHEHPGRFTPESVTVVPVAVEHPREGCATPIDAANIAAQQSPPKRSVCRTSTNLTKGIRQ